MKALLLPLTLYCISLFSPQIQALPVGDRLDFMTRLSQLREGSPESDPGSVDATAKPVVALDRTALWRALLLRKPPTSFEDPMSVFRVPRTSRPVAGASTEQGEGPNQTGLRSRRHASIRHHSQRYGQLMRVGCVLGTCQVQNLSHRLYQLVGQTGREDSSPVNPRSPHSYG
ncbi:protein ADM2a [Colossoma macropomum]|uniref:protein ADM2a n=1 Tax=Colossoma macropomum TaxID=42526 RepID=UPI0018643B8B|nr:protein ADM2a [Colossoma macropomum]